MPEKITLLPKHWILIFGVWLLVQMAFLYYNGGVVLTGESGSYIVVADRILASGSLNIIPRFYFYTLHILLLVAVRFTGLSYSYMYLLQLVIALVALVCFVKLLLQYCHRVSAVSVSALVFSVCPFYQIWTSLLYTDANFANLLLISIYLLTCTHSSIKQKLFLVCLLLLPFYRPLGVLLVPVAVVFWLVHKPDLYKIKTGFFILYALSIAVLIWYCLQFAEGYFYPGHNAEANIICGYGSELTHYIQHPYNPDKSILHFFLSNPAMTWRLLLGRFFKAFWLTRPYYSAFHNLVFTLLLVPFYCLIITGMVVLIRRKSFLMNAFLFVGLAIFTAPILLFCADWSNRFILPTMVFLFVFLGIGLDASAGFLAATFGNKRTGN